MTILSSCGIGVSTLTYSVGGTISGVSSGSVVLQNNGGDNLTISAGPRFTFAGRLPADDPYLVTVLSSPDGQTCTASNNSGTIGTSNVTNVSVVCSTNSHSYTVGGTISGLSGQVVLQNNFTNEYTTSTDGSFTFTNAVADGAGYNVSVLTNPAGQTCTASSNTGTIAGANVTSVVVSCSVISTYTVSGTVSGLSGTLTLQNNATNDLDVDNGVFTFTTPIADGGAYDVTVLTNPAGQTCTPSSNTGTIAGANITSVSVTCSDNPKRIFVTTATHNGNFGGVANADTFCLDNSPEGVTGTFKAMMSQFGVRQACDSADPNCTVAAGNNIDWVMAANTEYYRIDGVTPIGTTNAAGIFAFPITNSISASATTTWTGLQADWTRYFFDCVNWTDGTVQFGGFGTTNATDGTTLFQAFSSCNVLRPLYCVEQ